MNLLIAILILCSSALASPSAASASGCFSYVPLNEADVAFIGQVTEVLSVQEGAGASDAFGFSDRYHELNTVRVTRVLKGDVGPTATVKTLGDGSRGIRGMRTTADITVGLKTGQEYGFALSEPGSDNIFDYTLNACGNGIVDPATLVAEVGSGHPLVDHGFTILAGIPFFLYASTLLRKWRKPAWLKLVIWVPLIALTTQSVFGAVVAIMRLISRAY